MVDPFGRCADMSSDVGHSGLDTLGLIPFLGAVPDTANAVWYAFQGKWGYAGLSLACAIPFFGDFADAGKIAKDAVDIEKDTKYYGDRIAHCEFASNGEVNLYLRRNSASLLEDVVHEGTHGIDMYNKFGSNPLLTTTTWEFRAYQAEGEFQRAIGKTVQYPTGQSIMNHITNNYPNADLLFNPYKK